MNEHHDSNQLVSVIIPCYNHGYCIDEAVESVLQQSYRNFEIIIVDAGSNDGVTKEKLIHYNQPYTRVISSPHQIYPSKARNLAFLEARGDFILTLDADDILERTFIEKTLAVLQEDPGAGAASGKVLYFGYEDGFLDYRGGMIEDILHSLGSHLCALIRRSVWLEINGFDEDMNEGYEDWDFWFRLAKAGWSIQIVPEILFYYRQKEFSRVTEVFKYHYELKDQIRSKHIEVYEAPYQWIKHRIDKNFGNKVT
jgi:glycosyltransferase involved in cell wall biosynthesis